MVLSFWACWHNEVSSLAQGIALYICRNGCIMFLTVLCCSAFLICDPTKCNNVNSSSTVVCDYWGDQFSRIFSNIKKKQWEIHIKSAKSKLLFVAIMCFFLCHHPAQIYLEASLPGWEPLHQHIVPYVTKIPSLYILRNKKHGNECILLYDVSFGKYIL